MILKELIEYLETYRQDYHDYPVVFSFDVNNISNFDVEVYKDKIYIDLDYLNCIEE